MKRFLIIVKGRILTKTRGEVYSKKIFLGSALGADHPIAEEFFKKTGHFSSRKKEAATAKSSYSRNSLKSQIS
jgi:hypothetical protein